MTINIGNDELILHIRKNYRNCVITNDQLGKKIWQWLQVNDPNSKIINRDQQCEWGNSEEITSDITLPKSATQFQISLSILPQLYEQLAIIANS